MTEDTLIDSMVLELTKADIAKADEYISTALENGQSMTLKLHKGNFICTILNEDASLKFVISSDDWFDAIVSVSKGFFEHLIKEKAQ